MEQLSAICRSYNKKWFWHYLTVRNLPQEGKLIQYVPLKYFQGHFGTLFIKCAPLLMVVCKS